jgi:hypothetical protein
MIRRALGVAALLALLAACSNGPGGPPATTLPPTTRVPAPITPTGVVDTVRNLVAHLAAREDDAVWAILGPRAQAEIGGRDQYRLVRADLMKSLGAFGELPATYDGLPVADGSAVVVVHAPNKDGSRKASAVAMYAEGTTWRAEPFLDVGRYRPVPADRTEVAPLPELSVVVDAGTTVKVWVDGQPATVAAGKATGIDEREFAYTPATGLVPGWHLVTYAFQKGDLVAARTVRYSVPQPK